MSVGATSHAQVSSQLINPRRIFGLLVVYRWISLIPSLISVLIAFADSQVQLRTLLALGTAILLNLFISLYHAQLNQVLLRRPWLLAVDLLLVSGLIALTNGWRTPYYLYALSPLLAAAFFFQLRGALISTTAFAPLYLLAVLAASAFTGESPAWLVVVMALVGFYLISSMLGFASALVESLRLARDELAEAHRDLQVIHDLTISLQSAADVTEVEERVLEAVTVELGFPRAVVALVDQDSQMVSSWMGRAREGRLDAGLPHSAQLSLPSEESIVGKALSDGKARLAVSTPFVASEAINSHLNIELGHIFPLNLREHSVGVLLVDAADDRPEAGREDFARIQSLEAIANQAAVSLGTTMMCIDRAQRLAVQEERVRIARDIHDTVSQSLFGIVYTLDGCLKLLPDQPEEVEPELRRVLAVAEETRAEIRKSILDMWPSEMTAERFVADLQKFAADICQADDLQIEFSVSGDFPRLSSRARRSLYRISQEALANAAHHAAASKAQVCLELTEERALLSVRDNGRGFDPEQALKREYSREHFGLWGMQERALSLGGTCEINSQPEAGTLIIVDIPI